MNIEDRKDTGTGGISIKLWRTHERRLKISIATLLFLVLAILPHQVHSQADFSNLMNLVAPAVVKIDSLPAAFGSGFVVQYDTPSGEILSGIITACHVVIAAPKVFGEEDSRLQVNVTFGAWRPEITLKAEVVKCDAANDAALLQPVSESGSVTTLGGYFQNLSQERNDPSLRAFPRLWLGDSDSVEIFNPVFVMGYPAPFGEFTSVLGRTSGKLPLPNVVADDGQVDVLQLMAIYDGPRDRVMDSTEVLDFQNIPVVDAAGFAEVTQNIFDAGHGVVFLGARQPSGTGLTGWDAVTIEDGIVRVVERRILAGDALGLGGELVFEQPTGRYGDVSLFREFIKIDAPIVGGNSGGPVMNINGQVIGIIEFGAPAFPGANYANPINAIKKSILN